MATFGRLVLGVILILQWRNELAVGVASPKLKRPVRKACLIQNELENGYYVTTKGERVQRRVKPGYVIEARCNPGYGLRGAKYRRCNSIDILFNKEPPICTACLIQDELENGYYVDTKGERVQGSVKPGYVIEARCNPGYGLRGARHRRCNSTDILFNEEPPICRDIDECKHLQYIPGESESSWEPSETSSQSISQSEDSLGVDLSSLNSCHILAHCVNTMGSYRCECDSGFEGDGIDFCQRVVQKPCEPLEPPVHSTMEGDPTRLAQFECDKGYRIYGAVSRECVDGKWKGLHPTCDVLGCGDPGTPINGFKQGDEYEVGDRVLFGCDEGYELVGTWDRECLPGGDGQWSSDYWTGVQPVCRPIAKSVVAIADKIQTDFIDRLEVFTHSGRGRLAASDNIGLDLVFAYDTSTSLNIVNFERGVNFTESLLRQFGVSYDQGGTRVAVISFASEAEVEFTYGPDVDTFEEVTTRIRLLKDNLGGGTNLEEALIRVFDVIQDMRNGAKRALFLMTDGLATVGVDPAALAESLRRDERVEIFVVAVGEGIDYKQLRKLASQPYSTHVFLLENFEDLAQLTAIISEKGAEYKRCGQAGNLELPYNNKQQDAEQNANPGAWPWLAQVLRVTNDSVLLQCGGALLCEEWVITSGTCVCNATDFVALPPENFRVRLGAYELGVREDTEQEFGVSEVHLHKSYDPFNRFNDIALLKLSRSANLTGNVRTLCVPSEVDVVRMKSSSLCYVAGWGIVDPVKDQAKNDSMPPVFPEQLKLPLVNNDDCKGAMTHPYPFGTDKMCAGKRYKSHKACKGDTGSPLVCKQVDGSWGVAGVSSYSRECTEIRKYAMFTRVSEFTPWVHGVTGNCTTAYEAVTVGGFQ